MKNGRLLDWFVSQTIIGFWGLILVLSVIGVIFSMYYLSWYVSFYALSGAFASLWIHSSVKDGYIIDDKWGI